MTNPAKIPPITVPTSCTKGFFLSIIRPITDAMIANMIIFSRLKGKLGRGANIIMRKVIKLVKNPFNMFRAKSLMDLFWVLKLLNFTIN